MQLVNFCRSWHKFTKMPVCYLWGEISCFLVAMLIPSSLILQCIFSCLSNADISYKTVAVIGMILSVYVENAIQTDQTTSSLACIYLEAAKTGCLTDFTCVNCDYDNGTNCVWWILQSLHQAQNIHLSCAVGSVIWFWNVDNAQSRQW